MKLRETEPGNCFLILFTTTSSPDRQIKISGSEIFDDDLLLHKAPFPLKISKNFGVYPILKTDDQGSAFQKKASISFVSNLNHSWVLIYIWKASLLENLTCQVSQLGK